MYSHTSLIACLALTSAAHIIKSRQDLWQPAPGEPWQIVITNNISVDPFQGILQPSSVNVIEVDLFNTPKKVFDELHKQGKKTLCYFSAGTAEDWRPDYKEFPSNTMGKTLGCWPGEKYVQIKNDKVFEIMASRIKLASEKGCDAIDPDNIDIYSNDSGFKLTEDDGATYINKLAAEAKKYGISTGLKNALEILPKVQDQMQFAVNEECWASDSCDAYKDFNKVKPVFHVEYVKHSVQDGKLVLKSSEDGLKSADTETVRSTLCLEKTKKGSSKVTPLKFSTVLKELLLTGWVFYCDGTSAETPVYNVGTGGPSGGYCDGEGRKRNLF